MALEDEHDRLKKIKISYFPIEIIVEILSRLPVKSLLRYKSVCKSWCSLISDPCFIRSHASLSTSDISIANHRLVIHDVTNKFFKSCSLYDLLFEKSSNEFEHCFPLELTSKPHLQIIGSCNGLLCILKFPTLIIYNPSTRITSKLPKVPNVSYGMMHGFGYDESTDDYKVVMTNRNNVYIFSLKTGTWKKIGDFLHGHLFSNSKTQSCASGMFSNGALHWAKADQNLGAWTIVALDLAKETYCEVLQPVYGEGKENLSLGVLGQWLCVHCISDISRVLDVWVMKVYGVKDSWTKLVIPYPNDFWLVDYVVPLCFSNDGKVLLQIESDLFVYDIQNSSYTLISQNFIDRWSTDRWEKICIIVESLVSPCVALIRNESGSSVMENVIV